MSHKEMLKVAVVALVAVAIASRLPVVKGLVNPALGTPTA